MEIFPSTRLVGWSEIWGTTRDPGASAPQHLIGDGSQWR